MSYRRSDTANHAIALKLVLEQYLPDVVVFVDTESIKAGENWPSRLHEELENSSALIALMGGKWRFSPDGNDRLSDPEDWVRVELAHALSRSSDLVLPVRFVGSAADAEDRPIADLSNLPEEIECFSSIQNMQLRSDSYIEDTKNIARALATKLDVETRSQGIEYPTPNALKSKAPTISQSEFDNLKFEDDSLSGWRFSSVITQDADDKIGTELSKVFEFKNFKRAFSFMNEAALVSEGRPHHPVWTNKWNKVEVHLRTFDADQKVTWYDVEMASKMNELAEAVATTQKPSWPYNLKAK